MFLLSSMLLASNALAAGYVPLVQIPGLPTTGTVDMSAYLVGIYNFLLSAVGIVAVFMLILGGMKYITAVGSSSATGDAKETIWNAIFGLLLAILSWVFVSTINPDVLYLRQPGLVLDKTAGSCSLFGKTDNSCTCNEGAPTGTFTDAGSCNEACINQKKCNFDTKVASCLAVGSPEDANTPGAVGKDGVVNCHCADGNFIPLSKDYPNCQKQCEKYHCGMKFLIIKAHPAHAGNGLHDPTYTMNAGFVTPTNDRDKIFDFTLKNNGVFDDYFSVTGSYKTGVSGDAGDDESYDCAILITGEVGNWIDTHHIFWVQEGVRITTSGTLYDAINGRFVDCKCSGEEGEDCSLNSSWTSVGDCADITDKSNNVTKILHANFGGTGEDHCDDCSLSKRVDATTTTGNPIMGYGLSPNSSITCSNGYWQLSGA